MITLFKLILLMANKSELVKSVFNGITVSLKSGKFQDFESEIVELKDLSTGTEWTSLKQTICAFLNTNGGYIICGIKEKKKSYLLTGFDRNNESRLIELQTRFFKTDDNLPINLSDYIQFEYETLLNKTVAIISVLPLSLDLKYLKFDGTYYERILTQDKVILNDKLLRHREYKAELEYSKEISPVLETNINDLDIDKINQFIIRINSTGKKETVKKDLLDATDFLERRNCINLNQKITVLGLLLFGKEPFQHLEYRSEVDCYFETGNDLGRDKKYFQDDVINLMNDSFLFVWGHIKVGRSFIGGGRSEPEFPETLLREIVNNALAHRDYTINKFITIKINPGENIEIKNPGVFKQKLLVTDTTTECEVRRILPGVPETKNPKLANILKAFDKIESQGVGMATLVSVCLENLIDVPYYDLSTPDNISLVVPSGKLIDDSTERWLKSFSQYINEKLGGKKTIQHELVLAYLLKSEKLNEKRLYTILLSPSNNHFNILHDLKKSRLVSEHLTASTSQTPIYVVDRQLIITDFSQQIEKLTGKNISEFDSIYKEILNIIYRYNQYNKQSIRPSVITPEMYFLLYGKIIEPTSYESLGRKIRKICGDLLHKGVLKQLPNKSYLLKNK
jgi:ATP-dependent DNA helicase RecG